MLNPYGQTATGRNYYEMGIHQEVILYPVVSSHQMSLNLSECGQEQIKESNIMCKKVLLKLPMHSHLSHLLILVTYPCILTLVTFFISPSHHGLLSSAPDEVAGCVGVESRGDGLSHVNKREWG